MELGMAILACAVVGCTDSTDELDVTPTVTSAVVATFEMSNGNRLRMTSIGDDEIVVTETTPAGAGERFVMDDFPGATPLELFARLAPADAAVPATLVDLASDADRATWMAQRTTATTPGVDPIRLDTSQLGWQAVAATPGLGSCDPSTGYQYFEDHHCGQAGPYGYGVTEEYCDNGKAFNYWQRSTAGDMRHTYTRTAACDGTGRIRHSRLKVSGWFTVLDELIEANTVATYYSYTTGGVAQNRRSRAEPYDPFDTDAYVRLWSKFYSQVISNAP
ncbi:MAG: hypothetical protein R3B06_26795 [Kofleriaceae bacterium]